MAMRAATRRMVLGSKSVETLWRELFSDPLQWWDHRTNKVSPTFPDFKHKETGVALWIDGRSNPQWVMAELAALKPGVVPRSPNSWNTMLSGYVKCQRWQEVLDLFQRMQAEGVKPDSFTFMTVSNACASLGALEEGRRLHALTIKNGCESDIFVGSTLVNMYAKCGSIDDASKLFMRMPARDVVSWNTMIGGFVRCENIQKALEVYQSMLAEGVKPNAVTFVVILNACAASGALDEGRHAHIHVINNGFESDVRVGNCLVDMYGKCRSIDDAWKAFNSMPIRNVVTWNSMIAGCVNCNQVQQALVLYERMQADGVEPDTVTFTMVLSACAGSGVLDAGKSVHAEVVKRGYESSVFVGSALIDMYAKCGDIDDAWKAFNSIATPNVVNWTAMLAGFVKCEQGHKALEFFQRMQAEGVKTNYVTLVVMLNACASLGALAEGRQFHGRVIQSGWESNVIVGNSLIDMYAKCGSLDDAWRVFNSMPMHNVVSLNAMLGGLAIHGHGKEALQLFDESYACGVRIDAVTFVCLLSACSHAGLVEEGLHYFECMVSVHNILPNAKHYACVVDLLSRAGHLAEAEDIMRTVTSDPKIHEDIIVWKALLSACRKHGNLEIGKRIAMRILELDPDNASSYVLLSNMYATAGEEIQLIASKG